MSKKKKRTVYSEALCRRILTRISKGNYDYEACREEGICPETLTRWKRKHEWLREEYAIMDEVRWTLWFEECDARMKDASRDNGRSASATVQRDTNLGKYRCTMAQLRRPDRYGQKVNIEHSGVTEKRVVIVEKFDGAKIKRFQGN